MTYEFHVCLLSELRMAAYAPGDAAQLTDEAICKAVTLNENLIGLGCVLKPGDVLRLAASPSLEGFYDSFKALLPDVTAQPMYPGFPQQVMEMSEAEFRFHQALHYFSTYGMEALLGTEVRRGWLPHPDAPEREARDTRLMDARVIDLIPEDEAPVTVLRALLNRRERLTNPELALVEESAPLCAAEQLEGLTVRFKENLELLFPLLMGLEDREAALRTLRAVCAHSGDVLRCGADYLKARRYHLRTSEKRRMVKLLERFPARDLRENLMVSNKLRERNLIVLRYIDYNQYSRSPEHRELVRALRNGELQSWTGGSEALLRARSPEALNRLAQRPGYMVRMLSRLLALGYTPEALAAALMPQAGAISGHLLVSVMRALNVRGDRVRKQFRADVRACRSKRGAEMRERPPLEEVLRRTRKRAEARQKRNLYYHFEYHKKKAILLARAAVLQANMPEAWRTGRTQQEINRMSPEALAALNRAFAAEYEKSRPWLKTLAANCNRRLERLSRWLERDLVTREREWKLAMKRKAEAPGKLTAELKALEAAYRARRRVFDCDPKAVALLKTVLMAHFALADTPLKGRRVCLDAEGFDLEHSVLETGERSKDGGYIRSGISYRIPDSAKYVRFFVYWNDENRVDVDLHASGLDQNGDPLHVGWDADFRNGGVLHSGDITHSDAAEYIDIDLSAPIRHISANVDLYYGKPSLKDIGTCYVGLIAVDQIGAEVRHYDPANCFFVHPMTQSVRRLYYGYIDVQNRFVRYVGQPTNGYNDTPPIDSRDCAFSLMDYLDCLLESQSATLTASPEAADVVLTLGKSPLENAVSLVDNNFFLEY